MTLGWHPARRLLIGATWKLKTLAANTKIEWTHRTWNPVRGCSMAKGSETGGCLNCYAARMSARNLPELKSPTTGQSFARILESGPRWTGDVELIEKALHLPAHWRSPQRIFVNSMSDLFHEALPDEAIDRVFAVMATCPQHTFQVLTKRPERMLRYLNGKPLANLWLGTSVENQATAEVRVPLLLQVPAAVRFVSYEPALGPIDFAQGVDWIIVGGESGPGARGFDVAWARRTIEHCEIEGSACFVKQLGARPFEEVGGEHRRLVLLDRKGGDWNEWPADLRVREFPKPAIPIPSATLVQNVPLPSASADAP